MYSSLLALALSLVAGAGTASAQIQSQIRPLVNDLDATIAIVSGIVLLAVFVASCVALTTEKTKRWGWTGIMGTFVCCLILYLGSNSLGSFSEQFKTMVTAGSLSDVIK